MSDIINRAKRLLEGATPGPWEWFGYSLYSKHETVLDFQCVTEFGMSGASRAVEVTPEDEELIAAAPELAETVAGMEWEYQCQRLLAGVPDDWYTWLTTYSLESAKKQTKKHAAKQRARGYEPPSYRIRRRLVGDWEVVG